MAAKLYRGEYIVEDQLVADLLISLLEDANAQFSVEKSYKADMPADKPHNHLGIYN